MTAATQKGAAQGEEEHRLTEQELNAIKQKGYDDRLGKLAAISVDRDGIAEKDAEVDEDVERERLLAENETQEREPGSTEEEDRRRIEARAADQVEAQAADEAEVIDLAKAAKLQFRIKVDGKEEIVSGDKMFARAQKDGSADVRLAQATKARHDAEAALAEANKKLHDATSAAEKKAAEAAVNSSKEKLAAVVKSSMDALYEGDAGRASQLLTDGITDVVAATLTSSSPNGAATSSVDADRMAAEVEQRIEIKGALNKLFVDYPQIKSDPDYAASADRFRASYEEDGHSRAVSIALAGEAVAKKFGLTRTGSGRSDDARDTTLDGKRAAKAQGTDSVPRAGSATPGDGSKRPPSTSQVIAEMAAARRR